MFGKIINYFKSSYEEMRKVIWPNRKEVTSHSMIVVLSMLISMGLIAAIDLMLFNLLETLIYRR